MRESVWRWSDSSRESWAFHSFFDAPPASNHLILNAAGSSFSISASAPNSGSLPGELSGPVISSEKVSRESVSIPLNFQKGAYVGGLHTSGGKIGGKEKRMLSAAGLKLSRVKK